MFTTLDWIIIGSYLLFAFVIGVLMTRKASRGLSSYFVAERSLPWWWLGTSMVATTFASDTPLAITGIIANDGIAGNWFWWSWVLTYITMTVFFARKWRSSQVLTDVELIELRYGGTAGNALRISKAFYFSIIMNCVALGWVFRAMSKITTPFISWQTILGIDAYDALAALWPSFLVFDNFNNTITVLIIFVIVVIYSSMGGIRGVVLTDLFQFALAMITTIIFAVLAVRYVGGLDDLFGKLHETYPERANDFIRFWPRFDNIMFPFQIFLIYIGIQWWAKFWSDGSGYLAQRMNTARTPADAEKGALWFTLANFMLRTWPWVLVGLVALVVFPLDNVTQFNALGAAVAGDRELGYPILMQLILPAGLLGLTFASLMAAFMSTVDTHLNWGTSYLVNDIYRRFIRPRASEFELVLMSRLGIICMAVIAVLIASQINSIEKAWKFFISIASGLGLPQILRWIWWRANAWTEMAGMSAAFVASLILYTLYPDVRAEYLLLWTVLCGVVAALTATMITRPVRENTLQKFVNRTRPFGFWQGRTPSDNEPRFLLVYAGKWVLGVITVFSGLFGIGYFIRLMPWVGFSLLAVFALSFGILLYLIRSTENG